MVVEQHLSLRRDAGKGQHHVGSTASYRARLGNPAVTVYRGDETHLTTARLGNLCGKKGSDIRRNPLGGPTWIIHPGKVIEAGW